MMDYDERTTVQTNGLTNPERTENHRKKFMPEKGRLFPKDRGKFGRTTKKDGEKFKD
jgi:hypothetical protein